MKKLTITIATLLFSVFTIQCATSPTGRKQLHLMSSSELNKMGIQSFEELKKKTPRSTDATKIRIAECIAHEILEKNGFRPNEWEVVVFKDPAVNAFALPGKKIGVFEGLFTAAKNVDQVAAVMGHEVGHVIAEHGNERVSQGLLAQGALTIGSVIVDSNSNTGKAVMAGLGIAIQGGALLPFSRKHELEADIIGLRYANNAGFNPAEAVNLWQNMGKAAGGKAPPAWMSTHPSNEQRIQQIREELPKLKPSQYRANCG
jgi:predicted Zn-dependent protease